MFGPHHVAPHHAGRIWLGVALVALLALWPRSGRGEVVDDEPDDPVPVERGGWRFERQQSTGPAAPLPPQLALQPGAGSQTQTQTMLWARRDRIGVGLGIEQRSPAVGQASGFATAPAYREAGMLVGLSLATGESSQLTWQTPLVAPRYGDAGGWPGVDRPNERPVRLGLEFRKADAYADLRRGTLMKVELSRETSLALRPRAGRVGLTLTSRW